METTTTDKANETATTLPCGCKVWKGITVRRCCIEPEDMYPDSPDSSSEDDSAPRNTVEPFYCERHGQEVLLFGKCDQCDAEDDAANHISDIGENDNE